MTTHNQQKPIGYVAWHPVEGPERRTMCWQDKHADYDGYDAEQTCKYILGDLLGGASFEKLEEFGWRIRPVVGLIFGDEER